jgi:alcohol dehydrogenase class IV
MDCAKAICAKAAHPKKSVKQLQGLLKVHWIVPKLFAVPTTSGTGSETTVAAVITESETHHKAPINDLVLIPKYAVLDPELTLTLSPELTATTGMDALCHAVEAYTNHFYNTRVENIMAVRAVRLIYDNLYRAYKDGSDIDARENMQIAALYAGRAFTRGCVGYVHAIGHTMGGLYGVPHGKAMAILLPHVMRAFGPKVHRRLAELADACGITGRSDAEKAEKFISWIEEMKEKTGIPEKLDMIKDGDLDQIIAWAIKEANPLYPTPVLWKYDDFKAFIDSVRA